MAMGPIAKQVSAGFDEYWNHELAIPIRAFVTREPGAEDIQKARLMLNQHREAKTFQKVGLPQFPSVLRIFRGPSTPPILEVLIDLSTDIEVPAADVNEKRVSPLSKKRSVV